MTYTVQSVPLAGYLGFTCSIDADMTKSPSKLRLVKPQASVSERRADQTQLVADIEDEGDGNGGVGPVLLVDPKLLTRQCLALALTHVAPDLNIVSMQHPPHMPLVLSLGAALLVTRDRPVTSTAVLADLAALRSYAPDAPLLVLTRSDKLELVTFALRHGVRGYLTTDLSLNIVVQAIRLVCAGGTYMPPSSLTLGGSRENAELSKEQLQVTNGNVT
jgi:DNA-binding NarL/FixJ family response regulator